METFTVAYTSPSPTEPQPMSPVKLELAYVLYCDSNKRPGDGLGRITLKNIRNLATEFKIQSVRHKLDDKGNCAGFELFLLA